MIVIFPSLMVSTSSYCYDRFGDRPHYPWKPDSCATWCKVDEEEGAAYSRLSEDPKRPVEIGGF